MTRNRDIAAFLGLTEAANTTNAVLTSTADGTGVTVFTTIDSLPTTGNSAGDLAFVDSDDRLYIFGGGGWYTLSLVNATPSITSILDASSGTSPFSLSTDGTTTILTVTATDSDGLPLTFASSADADFNNLATISQDSSVFTITPRSEDSATTESGTVTFTATDGIATATSAAQTFTLQFTIVLIQNSAETVLLAKASGNSGTNDSFTDNSSSSHTITNVSNPVASSFSPYRSGGYYAQFDGTGDRLYWTPDTDINFGTGAFTVECWFWIDSGHNSEETMFEMNTTNYSDSFLINIRNSYGITAYLNTGSVGSALTGHDSTTMGSISSLASTGWTHLAIVRSSDTVTLYLNGKSYDSGSYSGQDFTNQSEAMIGGANNGNFHGRIFDFRIVKGTAVYTAQFTPPTEFLTDVSGTALLTCRRAWFYDESSNSRALTLAGDPTTEADLHLYDYAAYDATKHGGSAYFASSGDRVEIPWSSDFEFGSGDFTIEFWYNLSDVEGLISWGEDASNRFDITGVSNTQIRVLYNSSSYTNFDDRNGVSTPNMWQHFAVTRENDNLRYFINGVLQATVAMATGAIMPTGNASGLVIGRRDYGGGGGDNSIGYFSDVRLVKGTAVYTAAFTPPTEPLTAISGTSLLALQGDASIFDAAQISDLILNGNAASSTAQTKNATSSMYFDGTGDNAEVTSMEDLSGGPYTIEGWYYFTSDPNSSDTILWAYTVGTANGYAQLHTPTGTTLRLQKRGGTLQSDGTFDFSVNTWYHIATAWNGSDMIVYVDGTEVINSSTNVIDNSGNGFAIGGSDNFMQGYVEDFRITKGLSRYPFVPSEQTLTADSNTFLLAAAADDISVTGNWTLTNGGTGPTLSNFAPFPGMKSLYFDGSAATRILLSHTGTSADWNIGDIDNNAAANWSIEAWVYYDNTSYGDDYWFSNYSSASAAETFMLGVRSDGDLQLRRHTASSGNQIASVVELQKWQHYLFTQEYDSAAGNTKARLFVDGISVYNGTQTNTSPYDFENLSVGGRTDTSGTWHGYVSNLRVQTGTVANPGAAFLQFTPPTSELLG